MAQDDVIAVIRKRRFGIDISDLSISGGHDRIRGLAAFVALEASDIETLMHLPAIAADTTEAAALPGFANRRHKKLFTPARLKQGVIRCRKSKRLTRHRVNSQKENQAAKRALPIVNRCL